jgi:signal transduction histidine kinase
VSQFSHLADKKGVALLLEREVEAAHVIATVRDLEYAVSNLVSNAVNYTLEGTVRLSVELENQMVVLRVSDTGIGIPEDDLPECFRDFYRGENVTQHLYEGTGLGLSIVKKVVEKYGGDISLESTLGAGTTVTLWLQRKMT